MFGGLLNNGFLGDTWTWDGSAWTAASPTQSPSARYRHAMAFDPVNAKMLLFGGYDTGSDNLQDTWLFDGVDWQQVAPSTSPPGRTDHAMASDLVRQRVVLFGGFRPTSGRLGDTWEWDGTTWSQRSAVGPTPRYDAMMVYDLARAETVLHGGYVATSVHQVDTWVWDGTSWTERTPAHFPPSRGSAAIAFDLARNLAVVSGGYRGGGNSSNVLLDTWEWDGVDWVETTPLRESAHWYAHGLAYDPVRGRTIAFCGSRNYSLLPVTSEYGAYGVAPVLTPNGSGCPGSTGVPLVFVNQFTSPWIGDKWNVEVRNVPAGGIPVLAIGLAATSVPIPGTTGCTQLTTAEAPVLLQAVNGTGRWVQYLPGDPALVGVSLHYQGVVLQAGSSNALDIAVSAGLQATMGMW
ncbi:MAG: hypothetical protein KDE27_06190 [Planctomycetes bacterium]|nr:hypothetical protein [Planctomycetota bacterium]